MATEPYVALLRTIMTLQIWSSGFCWGQKRTDFEPIGRTQLSRQTAEMKFVALLLTAIAACSSSTPANDESPVSQQAGLVTRSLRGRQKRRPCAKSIATYCSTAKSAAR